MVDSTNDLRMIVEYMWLWGHRRSGDRPSCRSIREPMVLLRSSPARLICWRATRDRSGPQIGEMHALAGCALHGLVIVERRRLLGRPAVHLHRSGKTGEEESAHRPRMAASQTRDLINIKVHSRSGRPSSTKARAQTFGGSCSPPCQHSLANEANLGHAVADRCQAESAAQVLFPGGACGISRQSNRPHSTHWKTFTTAAESGLFTPATTSRKSPLPHFVQCSLVQSSDMGLSGALPT